MTRTARTARTAGIDSRAGALWGLALGETLAAAGDIGPALAVWDAVATAGDDEPDRFALAVVEHLLSWHASAPDDVERPSLRAIDRNGDPGSWTRMAVPGRAGGTVVRAAWLGVHPDVAGDRVGALAQVQALVTDAHPVAPVAAEVAAALTAALARGEAVPGRAAAWVRSYVGEARARAPHPLLVNVAGDAGAAGHLAAGWATLTPALCEPAADGPEGVDGPGSTVVVAGVPGVASADGALAAALRALDAGLEPVVAVERAARQGSGPGAGASSAAGLLGAFLGAALGPVFGTDWVARLTPSDREALILRECGEVGRSPDTW